MGRKDRQHYVSRSYLRNFSPELEFYLKERETWDSKRKKKFKDQMKIHFYDIEKITCHL
jgi:glutamine synthetase